MFPGSWVDAAVFENNTYIKTTMKRKPTAINFLLNMEYSTSVVCIFMACVPFNYPHSLWLIIPLPPRGGGGVKRSSQILLF